MENIKDNTKHICKKVAECGILSVIKLGLGRKPLLLEVKMRTRIRTHEEFLEHVHLLPVCVISDIDKRISDWLAAGGTDKDPYIYQQYKYAENVINRNKAIS